MCSTSVMNVIFNYMLYIWEEYGLTMWIRLPFRGKLLSSVISKTLSNDKDMRKTHYSWNSLWRHRLYRHYDYVDTFFKSRFLSLYTLYEKNGHFYSTWFLLPKVCFHNLMYSFVSTSSRRDWKGDTWPWRDELFYLNLLFVTQIIRSQFVKLILQLTSSLQYDWNVSQWILTLSESINSILLLMHLCSVQR